VENNIQTMLELCKEILVKVSFDKYLFQKELQKSINWIGSEEIRNFRTWVLSKFGRMYPEVIQSAFIRIN
jgi:hypothetical protein